MVGFTEQCNSMPNVEKECGPDHVAKAVILLRSNESYDSGSGV